MKNWWIHLSFSQAGFVTLLAILLLILACSWARRGGDNSVNRALSAKERYDRDEYMKTYGSRK